MFATYGWSFTEWLTSTELESKASEGASVVLRTLLCLLLVFSLEVFFFIWVDNLA